MLLISVWYRRHCLRFSVTVSAYGDAVFVWGDLAFTLESLMKSVMSSSQDNPLGAWVSVLDIEIGMVLELIYHLKSMRR